MSDGTSGEKLFDPDLKRNAKNYRYNHKYKEQSKGANDGKEAAPNETSSVGHVVNAYQFSRLMSKMNTEK